MLHFRSGVQYTRASGHARLEGLPVFAVDVEYASHPVFILCSHHVLSSCASAELCCDKLTELTTRATCPVVSSASLSQQPPVLALS